MEVEVIADLGEALRELLHIQVGPIGKNIGRGGG